MHWPLRRGKSTIPMSRLQKTRVACYGLIVRDGRILLCRLSQVERHVGKWTLPGGGIEFGEHPHDALVREVFEETGLKVESFAFRAIDSFCAPLDDVDFHSIRILFDVEASGELVVEEDGTTDDVRWFSVEELDGVELVELAQLGVTLCFS